MIAYEELEKALARWKTRRSNAPEGEVQEASASAVPAEIDGPATPAYPNPDRTGELELTDAEVSDA
jgi:hypothetical protein